MKQRKKLLAAFMALVLTCGVCFAATGAATLTAQADTTSNGGIVTTKDSLTFPLGSEVPFNGTGYLSPMIANEDVYHFPQTNNVTFAPGARSDWHTHGGMVILVTGGVGYYQEEGKTAQIIRQGDVLEIAPGVKHWHGAAPDSWFSQMVIYDSHYNGHGESEPVTDQHYASLNAEEYAGRTVAAGKPATACCALGGCSPYTSLLLLGSWPAHFPTAFLSGRISNVFSGPIHFSGLLPARTYPLKSGHVPNGKGRRNPSQIETRFRGSGWMAPAGPGISIAQVLDCLRR